MLTALRHFSVALTVYLVFTVDSYSADKSGVSPTAISVPKGPGSIEGLGESFQPTLNTGTAKYHVTLRLPAGTAGHAPSLALVYESGGGNGPLGFGWTLPGAFVQRRSDRGIPTYGTDVGFPRTDSFINESKEELVPTLAGWCFCKNEGTFVRYRQVDGAWHATRPDGTQLQFGTTPQARIHDDMGRTFSWLLERETDTRGNTIIYSYKRFPGPSDANQLYLDSIKYGPGPPPWTNYHLLVFQYEARPDWFEDCRAGFPIRTGKRLKSVAVGTHGPLLNDHLQLDLDGDGLADNLVRKYELSYLPYAGTDSHWSFLDRFTHAGADGLSELPPATFEYTIVNPPAELSATGCVIGSEGTPDFVMDNPLADLVDLDGDGLPDILKTDAGGGFHTAWLNAGEKSTNGTRLITWRPAVVMAGETEAQGFDLQSDDTTGTHISHLADMDGDGAADFVVKTGPGNVFYFTNLNKVAWGARRQMAVDVNSPPPTPFGSRNVRTADIDFDKRMDIVRSMGGNLGYTIWFNLGNGAYSSGVFVPSDSGFSFDFSFAWVQIADLNGDRVPDIAGIRPASVIVTSGLGYGRFRPPVEIPLQVDTPLTELQIARAKLTDITGDGLADLVIDRAEGNDVLWFWVNYGTNGFSAQKRIRGLPTPFGPGAAVRWADLNGNGTTDYVLADRESSPTIQTVDLGELIIGAPLPNALITIRNGIGRTTVIGYESSTKFRLEDLENGHVWPNPMPFPVSVVAAVTNLDSLGHQYVSRFRYHDGYYDPEEKQFRGFARVEQVDLGDVSAPTLVTRSHFDTGRYFEVMKGKLLRLTSEQEDGLVFTDESTAWTLPPVTLYTGTNGVPVNYVHPLGRTNVIKELGQGAERRLESEMDFDLFGNQIRQLDYGIVIDGDPSSFHDERITTTEYAINTNAWILRLPAREETADELGAVISRAEFFYDDETFAGDNWGLVTIGNLTMKREWKDPASADAFITSTRMKYDPHGNLIAILDPLAPAPGDTLDTSQGHAREITYDLRFHTYPITETIHLGEGKEPLVFRAAYDEGFGTVTSSTDFNENVTSYGYDTFARLTSIVKPGDTPDYPTVEYDYALAIPFAGSSIVNYVETRQLDKPPEAIGHRRNHYFLSRQFVDGLGRKLMTKTEAEPAPDATAPRVVVTEATLFNARQQPARVLNPFFSTLGGSIDDLLAFEHIEALGWTGSFALSNSLVTLDLPSAHATRTEYDATQRPIQVVNPDGTFRRTIYEPLIIRTFDENDNGTDPESPFRNTPMVHYNDGLGRLVQVDEITLMNDEGVMPESPGADPNTWTTHYEYDLNDQLTRITDSQNNVKTFAYDGVKRKTGMNDPDRGVMHFVYDDASNLTETTDAKGQRIGYSYDGANRIRLEKYHADQPAPPWRSAGEGLTNSVIYHYDAPFPNLLQGDNTLATARNVKGALAWVEDLSGEEHTSYDSRGRVEYVVKRIPDPRFLSPASSGGGGDIGVGLISYKTAFRYDSLDRLTNLTYPDADELLYEYNDRNLLRRIPGGFTAGQAQPGNILSSLLYLPSGQMAQIDYGNGVRTTYAYDTRLRLNNLLTVSQPSTLNQQLINFAYDFDGVSNIKSIADLRPGSTVPAGDPRRNTQLFQYDDLYRLTRVQYSFALPGAASRNDGEINYRYDRIGNMLAQTSSFTNHLEKGLPVANLGDMESGGSLGRWNRTGRAPDDPPGPHALSSITSPGPQGPNSLRVYPYDPNGNMTDIDGLVCTWDFKDRLVTVQNAEMRADYTYDYTDRRITKRVAWRPGYPLPSDAREAGGEGITTVSYINKYFEVREHDAPTKYVWNGNTRVARVTGSLNTNVRVQRLRVHPGWNLCSLAVNGPLSVSGGEGPGEVVSAAFKWNPASLDWQPVTLGASLPAGTVLWLQATTNATLTITGTYADPTNRTVTASGEFLPSAGLEAWNILSAISNQPSATLWTYDATFTRWLSWLPPPLELQSDLPAFLAPGQAVFARADAPAELEVPDSALRIRYYHQDHLGSSSFVSDAGGNELQETANYPFGQPRIELQPVRIRESYKFTQKEQDWESGLCHFEARFYGAIFGRFVSPDPVDERLATDWMLEPQRQTAYSYCGNRPLTHTDPSGLYAGADDLFAIGVGLYVGVGQQAVVDLMRWQRSPVESYVGSAVGTAVTFETALYSPATAKGLGSGAGELTKQSLEKFYNKRSSLDWAKIGKEAAWGSILPSTKIKGGVGGLGAVTSRVKTMLETGKIGDIALKTYGKELSVEGLKKIGSLGTLRKTLKEPWDHYFSKSVSTGGEKAYSAFESLGHSPEVRPVQTGNYGINVSQTTFSGGGN